MSEDGLKRQAIIAMLKDGGLDVKVFPRADTEALFYEILAEVKAAGDDVATKLAISGFTLNTITHQGQEQPCETCIYYLARRKHCDLPEIDLPVEPEWSCRLWRV